MTHRFIVLSFLSSLFLAFGCGQSSPTLTSSKGSAAALPPLPASISTPEDKPGFDDAFGVFFTEQGVTALEDGIGAEHRRRLVTAINLQSRQEYVAAERILDEIIAAFENRMTDGGAKYVSVANRAELAKYREEYPGGVVWFDYAYGEALHRKTVLAVSRRDFKAALKHSERALSSVPYAASGYCEHGFILNQSGNAKDGLTAYTKALELAETFEHSRGIKAMALRGIGFSKIELQDYEGAKQAFAQSLKIEPGNKIALGELEYIREVETQNKKN